MKSKRERIYIIPTRFGVMYACGILITLTAGAIYSNNLVYLLCFFLVALFLIGMVQTNINIKKLSFEKAQIPLVEEGQLMGGIFWFHSGNDEDHFQIDIELIEESGLKFNGTQDRLSSKTLTPVRLALHPKERGEKKINRIKVSTVFPFGMFYSWRYFDVDLKYYCFPQKIGTRELPLSTTLGEALALELGSSGDDFSEHKRYQLGQSQKHIDWKAVARGRPMMIKDFSDGQRDSYVLDYNEINGGVKERLEQLSLWVHICSENQKVFALKLNKTIIPANTGIEHKKNCLKELSTFGGKSA